MLLKTLLNPKQFGKIPPRFAEFDVLSVSSDSRKIKPNSLFVALEGPNLNGRDYIPNAIAQGAKVIVTAQPPAKALTPDVCVFTVKDTRKVFGEIVQKFYGPLSKAVKTIGITGTNGKTTVSYLCEAVVKAAGQECGVIGTVNYRYKSEVFPSNNTTPGIIDNQEFLLILSRKKISYCVMEVSSHALEQGRVDLIDFRSAIFTNLTSDHLDYHKNREAYFKAKAKLFTNLSASGQAIINIDDEYGPKLKKMIKSGTLTYGITKKADVMAEDIQLTLSGSQFLLKTPKGAISLNTPLIGRHNVYNILAAVGAGLREGFDLKTIKAGIESLKNVPGRLEKVDTGQNFHVFVDYAHTEDALRNVLISLKNVTKTKIILVFGCGGDRDKTKRPKMGAVGSELADLVILTNDNSRSEDPETIVEEIIAGCKSDNYMVVLDRQDAIEKALKLAEAGDVVLIAGKGHENYQIFKDRTVHFDDREVVRDFLAVKK